MADDTQARKAEALSVSRLKTPQAHLSKVKQLKRDREHHERAWRLNYAYYKGNQWVIPPTRGGGQLLHLGTEDGEKPRHKVRLVSNQIRPGVTSLVSKLTKTRPVMHGVPSKATDKAVRGAKVAESLLEKLWRELNLSSKHIEAWTWAQIGGQGFWSLGYDFSAGKTMKFTMGPDGQPITSDKLEQLFVQELMAQGVEPVTQEVALGEIRVDVLSPFDVLLDTSPSDFSNCQYAYKIHRMTPEEVHDRYGVWLQPDSCAADWDSESPLARDEAPSKDLVTVYVGCFKKTPAMPKGRYIVFTEGHEDFLLDTEWPYPFDSLPLVKYPGYQIPGSVYDGARCTDARPEQKEFNRTISGIIQFQNLNIAPQFIAPRGSMQNTRFTEEPNVIWYYNPVSVGGGSGKPEKIDLGQLPPYIFENLDRTLGRLRDIFHRTEVTEGNLPPNLEAWGAIDLLQDVALDMLEPEIREGEKALADAGTMILRFCQEYYEEPRIVKLVGSENATEAFLGADLKDVDVYVEAGSGKPRSRGGRMMRLQQLVEGGLVRPDQTWKYWDMADLKSIAARFEADEAKASRENDLILQGIPLNPVAIQMALGAVNQGMNPMTGQPLQDENEAQMILMDAALEPGPADNHLVEMDVHAALMKSEDYAQFPVEMQQALQTHYSKHAQAASAAAMEAPEPPRVSFQIKGTTGPSGAAALLQKSGVDVTPEVMSEPPLETWVTDSIDKADTDEAGNDPLTDLEMQQIQLRMEQSRADIESKIGEEKLRGESAKSDLAEKRLRLAKASSGS